MKHKIFFILLTCASMLFMSIYASAQGFYTKVGGGYGIGSNKEPINSYFQREIFVYLLNSPLFEQFMINASQSENSTDVEVVKGSLGQGGNIGLTGGYMFSKHIGAELGLSYFIGREVKSAWNTSDPILLSEEKKANLFLITPSLVFSAETEGVNPYTRIGALIGVAPKIKSTLTFDDTQGVFIFEDELTGGVAVGFSAALGVTYPLNPKVSVFGELVYSSLIYKPKQRKITRYVENGIDRPVTNAYAFQKQSIEDSLTSEYAEKAFDADKQFSSSYPFSNLGLNVGVRFNFGGSGLARGR